MLGLGWSEMLVIAAVVLIVVGPKDLPVMLRNLGRMMGTVRRMSNEFRREIDKAIAVDEFREAKKSISDPLKQTSADISREFNTMRNGKFEPSGRLAPADPANESVVDEIKAQAGMSGDAKQPSAASAALRAKVSETVAKPADAATTPAEQPAPLDETTTAKRKVKAAPRNAAAAKASATEDKQQGDASLASAAAPKASPAKPGASSESSTGKANSAERTTRKPSAPKDKPAAATAAKKE